MATPEELGQAIAKSIFYFRKNPHMLDEERHRDAVETIKCMGNHVYTDEAKKILDSIRSFIRNESG